MKITRTTLGRLALSVLASVLVRTTLADTPVFALNYDEADSGKSAFKNKAYWTDYASDSPTNAPYAPNSTSAVGLEFAITNSFAMRTTDSSICYGHLTVGTTESYGWIRNKHYNTAVEYRGGLTVVNGTYESTASGSGTVEQNIARIAGTVEVLSPETAPFVFGGASVYGVLLSADLSGAEGTGIVIGSADISKNPSASTLSGDNAAYLGSIHFASAGNATANIGSPTALGGELSEVKTNAIKLTTKDTGKLSFASAVGTCAIPATRGILFDGIVGGTAYPRKFCLDAEEGADVEICGPIYANGHCSNNRNELRFSKTGAGTVTLSGSFERNPDIAASKFEFSVTEGRLVLGSPTTIALTNGVAEKVWLKTPTAAPYALSGYTFGEGAGLVVRREQGEDGTFVLDSTCAIAATPIRIRLATDELGYDAYEACVMKIPTAVREVSAADFIDVDVSDAYAYPKTTFRVDVADGVQSVWLCREKCDTIAYLTFDSGFRNTVRRGVLDNPTVTRDGAEVSEDIANPRVTLHGDKETTLRENTGSMSVNGGLIEYEDVRDLFRFPAQTIEFYLKCGPQYRYQNLIALHNDSAQSTAWSFLFDNGVTGQVNDRMRISFAKIANAEAAPGNSGSPINASEKTLVGDGAWHHVAYTFDADTSDPANYKMTVAMYVDHELVKNTTVTGCVNLRDFTQGVCKFYIDMKTSTGGGNYYDGAIDELRITRGVLTPDQFLELRRPRSGLMLLFR